MSSSLNATKQLRSLADQAALVQAVYEADTSFQELPWLEWKGPLDLSSKQARVTIAKAILGFANRDPDAAARHAGGCAYLLVGVEPGALAGVEFIDDAQLVPKVETYCGRTVEWSPRYIELKGKHVLVVTVEPPEWGDPLRPVRKSFQAAGGDTDETPGLQDGAVYVRHHTETTPATSDDIDMLSRRAARQAGDELQVAVTAADDALVGRLEFSKEACERYVKAQEKSLLRSLDPTQRPAYLGVGLMGGIAGEYRTEDFFRKEVSKYVTELRAALPGEVLSKAIERNVGLVTFRVSNPTDTAFESVRVELDIPRTVVVFDGEPGNEHQMPTRPKAYGTAKQSDRSFRGLRLFDKHRVPALNLRAPDIELRDDVIHVRFDPVTVRADEAGEVLEPLWLIAAEDIPHSSITVRWEATSTSAKKRVSGHIDLPVANTVVAVNDLV